MKKKSYSKKSAKKSGAKKASKNTGKSVNINVRYWRSSAVVHS